jgi:hypothetical protein
VAAWTIYHLVYAHYPHTDDTDAEYAHFVAFVWAAWTSAIATLTLAAVELVLWIRRSSGADAREPSPSVRAG